jgi:serine protease Do
VILGATLAGCGSQAPAAQPTAQPATAVPATPAPTAVPPSPTPDLAVDSLDSVQDAVLYIEVDGGIVPLGETEAVSNTGSGSGFLIDPSGIAVTNNHVVTGAGTIRVYVGGKKRDTVGQDAKVVGISECSDLAVIQLLGEKQYPYLQWYDGQIKNLLGVVAFGFPLDTPSIDTTKGSISQVEADGESSWASLPSVIEHDARLNPGNSGGPLVSETGQVVGINYASNSKTNQYFAIGRDQARKLVDALKEGKDDTSLGINGEAFVQDTLSGIWVRSVRPGSAASRAGLKPGDVITSMYNTPMAQDGTMAKYCQVLRSHENEAINLEVLRPTTQEKLEGEINSDNAGLKVVGSIAPTPPPEENPTTYTNYQTITHDTGAISVDIPVEWSDITTNGTWTLDNQEVGIEIAAAMSNETFQNWTGPGMAISVSRSMAQTTSPDQLLDMYRFTDTCKDGGRSDYNDNTYTGKYDYWTNCKGSNTELYVIAFMPEDGSFIGMVQIQVVSEADQEALKRIVQSFQAKGDF